MSRSILVLLLVGLGSIVSAQNAAEEAIVDSSDMVLIPAGTFMMGAEGELEYSPPHEVFIDSFYMDKHEVTNAEYLKFCEATGHPIPDLWGMDVYHCGSDYPDYPVVGVNWRDASAYATWAGKRLPTEAEWEYAARGGLEGMNYPTGNETDSTLANLKSDGTVPAGSYPPNGYGLYDMAGNTNEWVADYFGFDYYKNSPRENPQGPEIGKFRVIRGGGWHSGPSCGRVFVRNGLAPNWVDFNVSFRCVRDCK
ncbi:MAG: formylglycine-generating enzyme family protein [Candidatus Zixiibacteriota bacterium]|nr:MAG: formylglycine-generating enzyme family protein [candidate division Zixibacteria bacterium]